MDYKKSKAPSRAVGKGVLGGLVLLLLLPLTGCASAEAISASPALQAELQQQFTAAGPKPRKLPGRPVDAQALVQKLYEPGAYAPVWMGDNFKQARLALRLLQEANLHGLAAGDYKADDLSAQLDALKPADAAKFDIALSTAVLQFLTDLHFGRIKSPYVPAPGARLLEFDAVEQLRSALKENRLAGLGAKAEPTYPLYRPVMAALAQYRQMAQSPQPWAPLPAPGKGVKMVAGTPYAGAAILRERLMLLGDLQANAPAGKDAEYSAELSDAVKRFQARHGLDEDGTLGVATRKALAVAPGQRARQLEMTLERIRWLPVLRPGRTIVVNLPSYRLWAFDSASATPAEALEMRVIVGAGKTQTPLFIGQLRYLEFNPYWNVPRSVEQGEIIPKLASNPGYLEENEMELISPSGEIQTSMGPDSLAQLQAAKVRVRQRPGAQNALGAVKFSMPNPDAIYLHSTSAPQLFARTKRNLSHGCIRVERPAELAEFVLADPSKWNAASVEAAMQPGVSKTVSLKSVIPVVLFYATALTDRQGRAQFVDDIYKLDPVLEKALQPR